MSKSIPFPNIESELEYLDEIRRAALYLHKKNGKSVGFYAALQENPFEDFREMIIEGLKSQNKY